MLKFSDVVKGYHGNEVLKGLSFEVQPGEIFGLLAANGGGKTTAMRIAMGLIPFDGGVVSVFDRKVQLGSVRGVGYMPEERGLYPTEKVGTQLRYIATLSNMHGSEIDTRLPELLSELGIAEYEDKRLKELSLGNKQRVQIAAALIAKPRLLILDEPFSGLDPMAVRFFCDLLRRYAAQGAAILFSSHQLDVVEQVASRVGLMKEGRIIFDGTLDELKSRQQCSKVVIRFERSSQGAAAGQSAELSFVDCPSVINAKVGAKVAELELRTATISGNELLQAGLRTEEIVEISYERQSLGEAVQSLFDGDESIKGM